jgi:hypothetical protein
MEDKIDIRWRKSSYSGNGGGNCVEIAGQARRVLVRDTKQASTGPVLRFTSAAWRSFAEQVKRSLVPDPRHRSDDPCRGHPRARECPLRCFTSQSW